MQTIDHTGDAHHRMQKYRARLRASGLRPVQIWVPDVRAPRLAEEAHRQSLLAAAHSGEVEAMTFIEEVADIGSHP